jgi:uncharacterized cysteine cluster protein YcgN (CxxCxxCC family)
MSSDRAPQNRACPILTLEGRSAHARIEAQRNKTADRGPSGPQTRTPLKKRAPGGARSGGGQSDAPFWKTKTLAEMSEEEWESLCDGCGKCCLIGLEDEDTGEIHLTDVACKLFDNGACRCGDYANRFEKVDDCTKLTPENVPDLYWLPKTCAYRLVAQGRDLFWWHPLISGDPETVHAANVSVRGKTRPERGQKVSTLMKRIVKWPESE